MRFFVPLLIISERAFSIRLKTLGRKMMCMTSRRSQQQWDEHWDEIEGNLKIFCSLLLFALSHLAPLQCRPTEPRSDPRPNMLLSGFIYLNMG